MHIEILNKEIEMTNEIIINGKKYATNDYEEGLFVWDYPNGQPFGQWIQISGTCDVSVRKIKYDKNKKAKIRKAVLEANVRKTY